MYAFFLMSQKEKFLQACECLSPLLKMNLGGNLQVKYISEAYDIYREYLTAMRLERHGMAFFDFGDRGRANQNLLWTALAEFNGNIEGLMLYRILGEEVTKYNFAAYHQDLSRNHVYRFPEGAQPGRRTLQRCQERFRLLIPIGYVDAVVHGGILSLGAWQGVQLQDLRAVAVHLGVAARRQAGNTSTDDDDGSLCHVYLFALLKSARDLTGER